MELLRWLGGIVICFWILGFIFNLGGSMVHMLLIIAAILFVWDMVLARKQI